MNGFTILSGDFVYDNIIHTSILEHWFNVFKGLNRWTESGYFYPYKNTIAQTDAYFLIGVIYSFFRIFNFDPFLSTELSNIVLKSIGFTGAYLLSMKVIKNHWSSLLVALIFTLNNASTIHIYRIQLNSVAFVPFLALVLIKIIEAVKNNNGKKIFQFMTIFGLLLGSLAMTSFYIAFFFILFMTVFIIFYLVIDFKSVKILLNNLSNYKYIFSGFIIIFISFLPFSATFLPKSFETGTKSYPYFTLIEIPGLIQMGKGNLFWGPIYQQILNKYLPNFDKNYSSEYYNMGFSPMLLLLFIFSLIWLVRNKKSIQNKFLIIIALSFLLSISLVIIRDGFSLWKYIFDYFYGAKALTVVSIFTLVLALPLLLTVFFYLNQTVNKFVLVFLISPFLILFELNNSVYNLNKNQELDKYSKFSRPNFSCNSFYVSGWMGQEKFGNYWEWINNQYAHNVSAMYISQKLNIPTLNGMASFIPKSYDLVGPNGSAFSPNSDEYFKRVTKYIEKNNLENVCFLDLNTQKFRKVN